MVIHEVRTKRHSLAALDDVSDGQVGQQGRRRHPFPRHRRPGRPLYEHLEPQWRCAHTSARPTRLPGLASAPETSRKCDAMLYMLRVARMRSWKTAQPQYEGYKMKDRGTTAVCIQCPVCCVRLSNAQCPVVCDFVDDSPIEHTWVMGQISSASVCRIAARRIRVPVDPDDLLCAGASVAPSAGTCPIRGCVGLSFRGTTGAACSACCVRRSNGAAPTAAAASLTADCGR
jgi:hypothetical protein